MKDPKDTGAPVDAKPVTTPKETPVVMDDQKKLADLVAKLSREVEALKTRDETRELEKVQLEEKVTALTEFIDEAEATGEPIQRAGDVQFEPYDDSRRALKIKKTNENGWDIPPSPEFPFGEVLGWKSPKTRNDRGWDNWIPVEFGDHVAGPDGEGLKKFLNDPPRRMAASVDNYVRRMGMVLARKDKELVDQTKKRRVDRSQRKVLTAGSGATQRLGEGVELVGAGAKRSKNPRSRTSFGPPPASTVRDNEGNLINTQRVVHNPDPNKE